MECFVHNATCEELFMLSQLQLERLHFEYQRLEGPGLKMLTFWNESLQEIEIHSKDNTTLPDKVLESISQQCPNLRSLCNTSENRHDSFVQSNDHTTNEGIESLAKLLNLQTLHLDRTGYITNQAFEHIVQLPQLTDLQLYFCTQMTDKVLEYIPKETHLRRVTLDTYIDFPEQFFNTHPNISIFCCQNRTLIRDLTAS